MSRLTVPVGVSTPPPVAFSVPPVMLALLRTTSLPAPLAVMLAPVLVTLVLMVSVLPPVASRSPVLVMPPEPFSRSPPAALASMMPVVPLTTVNPPLPMTPAPWMVPELVRVTPPVPCSI